MIACRACANTSRISWPRLEYQALRFGEFTLKSGRSSPYFFNAGRFNDGAALARLGRCYAAALAHSGLGFDHAVRPCLQGHPAGQRLRHRLREQQGRNLPGPSTARKPRRTARAGGSWGAKLAGRVVIVDDVITAGTAVRESIELIGPRAPSRSRSPRARSPGARPGPPSAVQEVKASSGSIA